MKKGGFLFFAVFAALCILLSLLACGGGGGGGDGGGGGPITPVSQTVTVTGTVAGTTIVAYNSDSGLETARSVAAGDPKSFSLTLATGASYVIYLIENEGPNQRIYPLYQGDTNIFTFRGTSDITVDLGYVNTASGVAIAANDPLAIAGVTAGGENPVAPDDLADSSISVADLEGNWQFHGLAVGLATNNYLPGWYRGVSSFDDAGHLSTSASDSIGETWASATPLTRSITPAGVLVPPVNNGRFMLTINKQMIISADTYFLTTESGVRGHNLCISQKAGGGPFSTADLAGTWTSHGLVTSENAAYATWYYATFPVDANGYNAGHTVILGSGGTNDQAALTFSIDATTGVVTEATPNSTFHGVMTQDKRMIVATMHLDATTYALGIYQIRNPATTYSESDLQGTWHHHTLIAGVSGTDPQAWVYGRATVSDGEIAFRDTIANGATVPDTSYTISIETDGEVIMEGAPTAACNAIMSDDKKMMISVSRNGGGDGYRLAIYQR